MKAIFLMLAISLLNLGFIPSNQPETFKHDRKLRRSESYWGLHFDRHVEVGDKNLGATLTEEMVDSIINLARPDFIQVDCKGHPGICSYPTEVGKQAVSYDKDPLALIRKVTDAHNVPLFMHYSGVQDKNYATLNPEEARFGPDGKPDGKNTSLWGPYVDKLLIPQIKELIEKYHVDGIWTDGECWSTHPDYQPAALKEFTAKAGVTVIPRSKEDPNYKAFLEFNRQKFIAYLNHYVDELHRFSPDFQICSNWAFSSLMPEPVTVNLDFLSGDFTPKNAVNTAAWQGRCLAGQGKPWDLMAWSFTGDWSTTNTMVTPKTALQLCQEAAGVISMGGGFQIYFRQNKDISFQRDGFGIMKEVADFMLLRREFCKGMQPVPQIGLLYSTAGWKNKVDVVYHGDTKSQEGILCALLDGQHAVEVLMTAQMKKRMNDFPVIVVPEWEVLEPEMITDLKDYVKNGGRLLVIGANGTRLFDDILGVKEVKPTEKREDGMGYDHRFVQVHNKYRGITCLPGTEPIAGFYATTDFQYRNGTAVTVSNYGKGMAAGIYADLGNTYQTNTSPVIRDILIDIMDRFFDGGMVKIEGSHKVHVVPGKIGDRLLVHLINTSGDHANPNVGCIDEIPALQNLKVSVVTDKKPKTVVLQPDGASVDFDFADGMVHFIVPELKIHTVIEFK
ncbi:MAG: hypothetical protein A2W90_14330 [Bacteroidetes bacterium GWF2_42_66]|nr:MAG: hypothetical protein A2W92_19595 [Bacteroidetes bacterium GWA2_42_15]OFY01582.1 MAG: hypothetical protein A2W89_11895 [Bacteroidetes bacterium GWE2_42_39]OFY46778.1 MAG: hypothetical protein A2W90_14330 [Bacteroidetes bacterium GWF2_42_66]